MANLLPTHKIFDNYDYHNDKLEKLFIDKEFDLKGWINPDNRMVQYQWWNQLYNIFTWENDSIKWLGNQIYSFIKSLDICPDDIDNYFIHGWYNVLSENEELPWHSHKTPKHERHYWRPEAVWDDFSLTGHYQINSEKSETIYLINNIQYDVKALNGTCTLLDPDIVHKTTLKDDGVRVSVAFDIIKKEVYTDVSVDILIKMEEFNG
jgi:hypothetical protein